MPYSDVGQIRSLPHSNHHYHYGHRSAHTSRTNSPSVVHGLHDQNTINAKGRMRWILSLGLLLPALAAIIGVVAWAVSAEVMMGARRDAARKNNDATIRFHQQNANDFSPDNEEKIEKLLPDNSKSLVSDSNDSTMIHDVKDIEDISKLSHMSMIPQSRTSTDVDSKDNVYLFPDDETPSTKKDESNTDVEKIRKTLTGTKVAEVIEKLVAQRNALNPNSPQKPPQIVVVAPVAEPSSKKNKTRSESSSSTSRPFLRTKSTSRSKLSPKRSSLRPIKSTSTSTESEDYDDIIVSTPRSKSRRTSTGSVPSKSHTRESVIEKLEKLTNIEELERQHRIKKEHQEFMSESTIRENMMKPPMVQHETMIHIPQHSKHSSSRIGPSIQTIVGTSYMHQHQHQHQHQPTARMQGPQIISMTDPLIAQPLPTHIHQFSQQNPINLNMPLPQLPLNTNMRVQNPGPFPQASAPHPLFLHPPQQFPSPVLPPPMPPLNNDFGNGPGQGPNRAIHLNVGSDNAPLESGQYGSMSPPNSDKGVTFHMGGGPMGGGGQIMTSPLGIMKTLLLPLMPKPRMNLNGKIVFGVVLENGVGFGKNKKPKVVAQHYSEGHY